MTRFRHLVFAVMIPVNVLLILWVWVGRGLFGATLGWVAIFATFTAVPVMAAMLTVSTVLARRQPTRPRLTSGQAWTQVTLWVVLVMLGAVVFDVADNSHEQSILINVVGWQPGVLDLSANLMRALAVLALVCWTVLVMLLVAGRQRRQSPANT